MIPKSIVFDNVYAAILFEDKSNEAETKWPPFTGDILNFIFLNENIWILIEMWLKLVPKGPIDNMLALVQIMAWRWTGDKPLSEPVIT